LEKISNRNVKKRQATYNSRTKSQDRARIQLKPKLYLLCQQGLVADNNGLGQVSKKFSQAQSGRKANKNLPRRACGYQKGHRYNDRPFQRSRTPQLAYRRGRRIPSESGHPYRKYPRRYRLNAAGLSGRQGRLPFQRQPSTNSSAFRYRFNCKKTYRGAGVIARGALVAPRAGLNPENTAGRRQFIRTGLKMRRNNAAYVMYIGIVLNS